MKPRMMPERTMTAHFHGSLSKRAWRTIEKRMPPTAAPNVTQPVATPSLTLNHWLTIAKATVAGGAGGTQHQNELLFNQMAKQLYAPYIPPASPAMTKQVMNCW